MLATLLISASLAARQHNQLSRKLYLKCLCCRRSGCGRRDFHCLRIGAVRQERAGQVCVNTPDYNSQYYTLHKQRIAEQRRARRLALTEEQRERKRVKAREYAAKQRVKLHAELTELIETTNRLADMLAQSET